MRKKRPLLLAMALLPLVGFAVDRNIDHAAHVSLERANLELTTTLTGDTATTINPPADIATLRPSVATTVRSVAATSATRGHVSRSLMAEDAVVAMESAIAIDKLSIDTTVEIDNVASIRTNAVQIKTESSNTASLTIDNLTYTIYLDTDSAVVSSCATDVAGAITIPSTVSYEGKAYTVKAIGYCAFIRCTSIESVVIPEGVITMDIGSFYGSSLSGITLPSTLTTIGVQAFTGCDNLESIAIPESVDSIGYLAFWDCSYLVDVTLPSGLTSISNYLFWACTCLKNISIPSNVESIGACAFSACYSLSEITLPAALTSIGDYIFSNCPNLSGIDVAANNQYFASIDGVLFNKDISCLYYFPMAKNVSEYTIPEGVSYINAGAFTATNLTAITLPESLKSIGMEAFWGSPSLSSISLPENVDSIGIGAFSNCSNLSGIEVVANNQYFASIDGVLFNKDISCLYCFPIAKGDSEYTIPESVLYINECAFYGCASLMAVTLPESISYINDCAFYGCASLMTITLPEGVTSIGIDAFAYCDSLTQVTVFNPTPIAIQNVFIEWGEEKTMADMTLYVPSGSKSAYEAADEWCEFGTIVEDEFISGLTSTTVTTLQVAVQGDVLVVAGVEAGTAITVYNVQGAVVASLVASGGATELPYLPSGIYLIKVGNEVVKVVR